jgi:hypothetical protein
MTAPPSWLQVTPPLAARWRWAGTTELVGEPVARLPRATTYALAVETAVKGVDGSTLRAPFRFTFTTPLP